MAFAIQCDRLLLHHLQQSRLGFGWCAVNLVSQQQIGKHRPLAQNKAVVFAIKHVVACHIAGHQVGCELQAFEIATKSLRQGAHQQGLAHTGYAFKQDVPTCKQGG